MTARAQIRGKIIGAYLGSRSARRSFHSLARIARGGNRPTEFYYRVDDPYSHLLAQALPAFVEHHGLSVELIPVGKASAGAHPEPHLLAMHAARDAALLADQYGLSFPSQWQLPSEERVRRAHAVLLKKRPADVQLEVARQLGEAIWRDRGEELGNLVEEYGSISGAELTRALESNHLRLERSGHYQSGMLQYGGEWYWGVDRLWHLEQRLHEEGSKPEAVPKARPQAERRLIGHLSARAGERPTLEHFFSFRSPYSYISLRLVEAMHKELDFDLVLRPVLPMVMRGLPVPRAKRLYMVHDAKREADRLDIPFGQVCDPVGRGVEQCIPVCLLAARKGLGLRFAKTAMQAIWSEAVDVAVVSELVGVARCAGLTEDDVHTALAGESWRDEVARNRATLFDMGLWGVPSFRLGEFVTWGQDRLPHIAERIRILTGTTAS